MPDNVYRVLVVDDSPFICRLISEFLKSGEDLDVVGMAHDVESAVARAAELEPDAITLDLEIPSGGGLEVIQRVMARRPTAIVVVSGVSHEAATTVLKAFDLGAVDFIFKYVPGVSINPEVLRREIVAKVRAGARGRVAASARATVPTDPADPLRATPKRRIITPMMGEDAVVVIGSSTGGPLALRELLAQLPADYGAAIIIVQHMPGGFTKVLAGQLDQWLPLTVQEARGGDRLLPGNVFVAPGDYHLMVTPDHRVELNAGPRVNGHRPSIDVTMQSAADAFGARAAGVILSGMGEDGAHGLATIRARGGHTFAQTLDSCVISSMPREAIARGGAEHVESPARIGELLRLAHTRATTEQPKS